MILLAIDTALTACSAAVLETGEGDERAFERIAPMSRGHAEALLPLIEDLMAEAGIGFSDIDRFATTVGPGTFTGVRVGVAAARGFALATGRPVVGVTTLAAMAETARMAGAEGPLLVAMDARRGEIYAQSFDASGNPLTTATVAPMDAVLADLPREIAAVAGSAARCLAEAAADRNRELEIRDAAAWPRPAAVARLARAEAPGRAPAPLYLRPPDARPQTGAAIARQ